MIEIDLSYLLYPLIWLALLVLGFSAALWLYTSTSFFWRILQQYYSAIFLISALLFIFSTLVFVSSALFDFLTQAQKIALTVVSALSINLCYCTVRYVSGLLKAIRSSP
ncbi:MAG TPA: hypothetical protein PKD24_10310 [Pyrinomonadaceae bacterium]|nr:hypothetical protein [Pyrinomonadaceae bacterium]HMP65574.1 hypothetical protein [Pyrinomonadaceae bacterium]